MNAGSKGSKSSRHVPVVLPRDGFQRLRDEEMGKGEGMIRLQELSRQGSEESDIPRRVPSQHRIEVTREIRVESF